MFFILLNLVLAVNNARSAKRCYDLRFYGLFIVAVAVVLFSLTVIVFNSLVLLGVLK